MDGAPRHEDDVARPNHLHRITKRRASLSRDHIEELVSLLVEMEVSRTTLLKRLLN